MVNRYERNTMQQSLDRLIEIRTALSNIQTHGCLEATGALINVSQAIGKLNAVLESVDR